MKTNLPPRISTRFSAAQPDTTGNPVSPSSAQSPTPTGSPRSPGHAGRRQFPTPLQQSMGSAEKNPAFERSVRQMIRENPRLSGYNGRDIIKLVQQGEGTPLPATSAGLQSDLQYVMKRRTISGVEIALLFGSRNGKIVDARIPDDALISSVYGTGQPAAAPTLASEERHTRSPAQPPENTAVESHTTAAEQPEITVARAASRKKASTSRQQEPAPVPAPSFTYTSFASLSSFAAFPDEQDEAVSEHPPVETPASEAKSRLSSRADSVIGDSTDDRHDVPAFLSGSAVAKRLREEVGRQKPGSRDGSDSGKDQDGSSLGLPRTTSMLSLRSLRSSPRSESVMSIRSIEDALPSDEEKVIPGEAFAKRFEKLLGQDYPWLQGAIKTPGNKLDLEGHETQEQMLNRTYVLTIEHRFMYAMLETLKETLKEMDIAPDAPLHLALKKQGRNIDELLQSAARNAVRYCEASTLYNHISGKRYERIGEYASRYEAIRKQPFHTILDNFDPKAEETFKLLYETLEHVRGFKDIPAHLRSKFVVDPQKIALLPNADNQLLMFLCDYDREYAHKLVQAIPFVMDENNPVGMDLIKGAHHIAASGSTAFDTSSTIVPGFSEQGPKFYLHEGLHYTEAGKAELYAFQTRVAGLKKTFLQKFPEMESALEDSRVEIVESGVPGQPLKFGRTDMPAEFLEFCINQWLDEMHAVLGDGNRSVEDKKRAAIQFCKNCEHLHPFMDGNGRVFETLLPLRLYHDIDGSLPLLDYPGRMDGHSVDELLGHFDKACRASEKLKQG